MIDERNSEIHLRPRFKFERSEKSEELLSKFSISKEKKDSKFKLKVIDHHVIIDIPKDESHFWSPQLHLEIEQDYDGKTMVRGLFGPKPQVWSLFIFIHFGVGVAFLGFLTLWYVRHSLNESVVFPIVMVVVLPILWSVLYFLGRIGKSKGNPQMQELYEYMKKTLGNN